MSGNRHLFQFSRLLSSSQWALIFALFFATSALIGLLISKPVYSSGTFSGYHLATDHPFVWDSAPSGKLSLKFSMDVGYFSPKIFAVHADDCLKKIAINGTEVVSSNLPIYYGSPQILDLSKYLHLGRNQIDVELENFHLGAALSLQPAPTALRSILLLFLTTLAIGALLRWIMLIFPRALQVGEAIVCFIALTLRLIYSVLTPYWSRCYDVDGHVFYIKYIMENWGLPPSDLAWETHQPPLYYVLTGALATFLSPFHATESTLLRFWQIESLLLSCFIFVISIIIGRLIFPEFEDKRRPWFLLIIATLPAVVFYASRITNDVLFAVISFAWLALLLRFLTSGTFGKWICLCAMLGVGLLAKNTTLILACCSFLILALSPHLSWQRKLRFGLSGIAIITVITGWLLIPKALASTSPTTFVVGNIRGLGTDLRFQPSLRQAIEFNPKALLDHPYNSPRDDNPRRGFFWEFWFKSAFFGEWKFPSAYDFIAKTIVTSATLLIPIFFFGMWKSRREPATWPIFLVLVAGLAAQLAYTWQEPYAPMQDFRHFILYAIPIAYFISIGIFEMPRGFQLAGKALLTFSVFNWILFLGMLCYLQV